MARGKEKKRKEEEVGIMREGGRERKKEKQEKNKHKITDRTRQIQKKRVTTKSYELSQVLKKYCKILYHARQVNVLSRAGKSISD